MTIYFNGKPIQAKEGDTIASALYRAGVRIFSRSFKYHRPRGLLCVAGRCPNCLMNVDGIPNVRTCSEPVREGMQVRHQNAYPSLESDVLSVVDKLDRFLPPGFYYKTFLNKQYWHSAEPVIRRIAGLGVVPEADQHSNHDHHTTGYEHQNLHTDIAVVGGGPAGMSAALAAAESGAHVTLVEEQPDLGGYLLTQACHHEDPGEFSGLRGSEIAARLAAEIGNSDKINVLSDATVFGAYEGLLLGVLQGKRLIHLRSKRMIVATGVYEYPLVFHNNDLPGVMLGSGVQRLIRLHDIKPGNRAVVVTTNELGLEVACDLLESGVEVAAIITTLSDCGSRIAAEPRFERLRNAAVPIRYPCTVKEACGAKHLSGIIAVKLDELGRPVPGTDERINCDLLCVSTGYAAANGLLFQTGCDMRYDPALGMFTPIRFTPNVFATGDVLGRRGLAACLQEGRAVGNEAAGSLSADNSKPQIANSTSQTASPDLQIPPAVPSDGRKKFACFCMDVTQKDIEYAVAEGFDDIELLKRYTAVGMGPCQGKMCGMNNISLCGKATGHSIAETGVTTTRPPMQPIPLGALAGAAHHPTKLTALHYKHLALGAKMMDMGEWKRPLCYRHEESEGEKEYRAVRERVGVIDISTLGKLDVKGKDAGKLLDKIYTHIYSNLPVGKTRYGLLCDDSGIMLDDGTVTRLAEDHYFITTSTGNIDFVEQWLTWWAAGTGMCVHVTNMTAGYASVNLAGPHARDALKKLTDLDLSAGGFPYMASAQAEVAGVPCLLLRIGFVGETGWEIHCPAEYAEHLWDELMNAGEEWGIAPFGVEAQRLLRLEKKHVIVGVDTDALSNPLEADLAWVVRWEKPDFIGKSSLLRIRENGLKNRLVGFVVRDASVPEDGCAVVNNGSVVGRVTSCRYSPHVGSAIGFAWVPVTSSEPGSRFCIGHRDQTVIAEVVNEQFYDPEGARLRA